MARICCSQPLYSWKAPVLPTPPPTCSPTSCPTPLDPPTTALSTPCLPPLTTSPRVSLGVGTCPPGWCYCCSLHASVSPTMLSSPTFSDDLVRLPPWSGVVGCSYPLSQLGCCFVGAFDLVTGGRVEGGVWCLDDVLWVYVGVYIGVMVAWVCTCVCGWICIYYGLFEGV